MAYVAPKVTVTGSGGSTFASSVVVATSPVVSTGTTVILAPAYSSSTLYSTGNTFSWSGANIAVTGTGIGTSSTTVAGCNTPDTVIWQGGTNNVQIWATCNAGATTAFIGQTYPSNTAPTAGQETWMGAYYQWGNNADNTATATSGTQVNASTYNPSNYYNSSTFITNSGDWSSVQNDNLWGNTTNTSVARQGPCPTGYHVPTAGTIDTTTEWGMIYAIMNSSTTFGLCTQANVYDRITCALKVPYAGYRVGSSASYNQQGSGNYYWASSVVGTFGYSVTLYSAGGTLNVNNNYKTYGFNIRCLRN